MKENMDKFLKLTLGYDTIKCKGHVSVDFLPVSGYLGYEEDLEKMNLNTTNNGQGHLKSNPKSSTTHFASTEILTKYKTT